jgi:glucose-1-phosphate cytidylyltransferase
MKVVILAGGLGTRLSEETSIKPKPMVEIGGRPILWHIMKMYSAHGLNEFIICLGYKGYLIKEYFANYWLHRSDVTFDLSQNRVEVHENGTEHWRVTLVDTGEQTMTGGRLKQVRRYLPPEEPFCLTYGDGVSDIDLTALIEFHKRQGTLATLTAIQPLGKFGAVTTKKGKVVSFREKPSGDGRWINGGFFVLSPAVIDLIENDATSWEHEPLERLAAQGQLSAYHHQGFWRCMDTLSDKYMLNSIWESSKAPWKVW